MSTRCCFGKLEKDSKIIRVGRIHCDGYINGGVGYVLQNFYMDESKIDKLFTLGYISSLGAEPELEGNLSWKDYQNPENYVENTHFRKRTAANPEDECYYEFKSLKDYLDWYRGTDCEYCYLFKNGEWKVYRGESFRKYTAKPESK